MKERARAQGIIMAAGLAAALFSVALSLWLRRSISSHAYSTLQLLPDLALLVLILIGPACVAVKAPRAGAAIALVLCVAWAAALCSQFQFFLHTGYFASRPLIYYAAQHMATVGAVAASGMDAGYVMRVLGAVACICLACSSQALRDGLSRSKGALAIFSAALVGTLFFVPASIGALSAPLWNAGFSNDLPPLLGLAPKYAAPHLNASVTTKELPNIVLWIIESGRADLIDVRRPSARPRFLNSLSREAVSFEKTYTTTSHTSKALVGILCGHYPHPRMEIIESIPGNFPIKCLPHLLKEAGYSTYFLQAALGAFENRRGLTGNLGFQTTVVQEDLPETFLKAGYFGMDERALLDHLSKFSSNSKQGPIFLTLLTNLTHHPYAMPGQRVPAESAPSAYGTAVEYVDAFLAEAYQRMGAQLDWNSTLLIVLGDHGEAFSEHGLQQHDSVSYEEVVRIPLLIRYPALLAPKVDGRLTQTVDLLPSIMEILGLDWSGSIAGQSMFGDDRPRPVVTSCWPTRTCHSVIFPTGMKVVFYFGDQDEEVYALPRDPWERTDLSATVGADELVFEAAQEIARARHWAEAPYMSSQIPLRE